jgi:hypothetical protein
MLRIRHGWLAVMLAMSVVSACKKDEKSDTSGGVSGGGVAGAIAKAADTASGDDLALLPADSEVVVGINVGQIQGSGLWKQFVAPQIDKARTQNKMEKYNELKDKCGLDPLATLKTVTFGFRNTSGDKPDGVIVIHGLDKAKALACPDKMKEDIASHGTEVTRDGDTVLVKNKQGDTFGIAFANDNTAVVVLGDKATAAGVKAVMAGGSALKTSPAFVAMYSKVKTGDSVWFLVNGKLLDQGAMVLGAKPQAAFGSLNVTDGLSLDTRMRLDSADAASQAAAKLKAQTAQIEAMVDKVDVGSDADQVKISVVLSNAKLQALITQFAPLFGLGGLAGQH